jgi:hypothetical protein
MKTTMNEWLRTGKYLPEPLRDFHDQKDVFKAIHESIYVEGHEYAKSVDWVAGQCYVIDIFLWWMAKRGYTLQRTRRRDEFRDLSADVAEKNRRRSDRLNEMMREHLAARKP